MKFKVGDRVKVIELDNGAEHATIGDIGTIKNLRTKGSLIYAVEFDVARDKYHSASGFCKRGHGYWCSKKMLELVKEKPETIVIYRKGNETIALDKRTGKKAVAKCNPVDTFNFDTGAKLAFERLIDNISVEEMRKKLIEHCHGVNCSTGSCKLHTTGFHCGRGVFFNSKDAKGNYRMSDDEIKKSYDVIFGNKETEDPIKVGDVVHIVREGLIYKYYIDWVEHNIRAERDLRYKFDYGNMPNTSNDFIVKCIAEHLSNDTLLAYIRDTYNNRCYVIEVEGLKKC